MAIWHKSAVAAEAVIRHSSAVEVVVIEPAVAAVGIFTAIRIPKIAVRSPLSLAANAAAILGATRKELANRRSA